MAPDYHWIDADTSAPGATWASALLGLKEGVSSSFVRNLMEDFFSIDALPRSESVLYEEFPKAMAVALLLDCHESCSETVIKIPERICIAFYQFQIVCTQLGAEIDPPGPVTIDLNDGETLSPLLVDMKIFRRICTALQIRQQNHLPVQFTLLTAEGRINLRGVSLHFARLAGMDLTDADLSGVNLHKANLTGAILSGALLSGANLTEADLSETNLSGARMEGTVLRSANLTNTALSREQFKQADLLGADLRGVDLNDVIRVVDECAGLHEKCRLPQTLPATWDIPTQLRCLVGPGHPPTSNYFTMIKSIPDQYPQIQEWLIHVLFVSVSETFLEMQPLNSLMALLDSTDFCAENINDPWFTKRLLAPYAGHRTVWPEYVFNQTCDLFEQYPSRMFANNHLFTELVIYHSFFTDPLRKSRIEELVDLYMNHENVLPYRCSPTYVKLTKRRDDADDVNTRSHFLFSTHPGGPVILLSTQTFFALVSPHSCHSPNDLYVFEGVKKQPKMIKGRYHPELEKLFTKHFPYFLDGNQRAKK